MHVDCIGDLKRYSIYHEKISHYMMKKGHFKQILIFMHAGRKSRKTYEEEYGDQVQLTRYEQLTQEADIWQSPLASVTDNDGQESTSQSARMSKECVIHAGGKSQKAYEEEYGDQAQLTHYKSLTQETDMLQPALVSVTDNDGQVSVPKLRPISDSVDSGLGRSSSHSSYRILSHAEDTGKLASFTAQFLPVHERGNTTTHVLLSSTDAFSPLVHACMR